MKHILITISAVFSATLSIAAEKPELSIQKAVLDGNIAVLKQHLAAGTDVNAKGEWEETPLHRAASVGHKEITKLLIANGADVNAKDDHGQIEWHLQF